MGHGRGEDGGAGGVVGGNEDIYLNNNKKILVTMKKMLLHVIWSRETFHDTWVRSGFYNLIKALWIFSSLFCELEY